MNRRIEWLLLTAAILLSIAVNLPQVAASFGIDQRYVIGALVILVLIGLVHYAALAIVLTVGVLAIGANLPGHVAERLGIAPEVLMVTLLVVIGVSLISHFTNWLPLGMVSEATARRRRTEALLGSIYNMDIEEVADLLSEGVSANVRSVTYRTPLMLATALGERPIVRLLLRHGADVHAKDKEGVTALAIARRRGLDDVAEDLINAGAME